jgi:hypothetical protein
MQNGSVAINHRTSSVTVTSNDSAELSIINQAIWAVGDRDFVKVRSE